MKKIAWLLISTTTGILFAAPKVAPPNPPPTVFTQVAKKEALSERLSYPARLIAKINASILSEAEGVITQILAPLGTPVKKGQKLFVIKNTDPVYDYAPYIATAIVPGVMSSIEVTEGTRVSRGTRLGAITDPKQTKALIEAAVSDMLYLHTGLLGDLKTPGSDTVQKVKVIGASPLVDPATGTATVELAFVKPESNSLPPGLIGNVTFQVKERQGIQVPETALIYKGKDPFLRIAQEGKAKLVPVKLGSFSQGQVEITQGLADGAEVILRSSAHIVDGDAVTVQKPEESKG